MFDSSLIFSWCWPFWSSDSRASEQGFRFKGEFAFSDLTIIWFFANNKSNYYFVVPFILIPHLPVIDLNCNPFHWSENDLQLILICWRRSRPPSNLLIFFRAWSLINGRTLLEIATTILMNTGSGLHCKFLSKLFLLTFVSDMVATSSTRSTIEWRSMYSSTATGCPTSTGWSPKPRMLRERSSLSPCPQIRWFC